ncbi:dihydrodipicolinate synthase family protein [Maridesulfovibrio sp.]|uniref:dihydrodipicolinate synthase family protein n=1 Tax=Maridesulfovibrio sp. TaxID=2795000 RepID=UPI002AA836DD|nr:dihydrodipicolinate synthase family protein [Maridesulfovibrio sp.]
MVARTSFINSVEGPVFPILTPFTASGDIDFNAVENYVDFLIRSGAQTLMVTIGTSRFNLLSEQEMLDMNACVVNAAEGKATTIVTTPPLGSLRTSISFAQHAERIGADAILGVYPERYYGDDSVTEFFSEMCKSTSTGVMIHLKKMDRGAGRFPEVIPYSMDILENLYSYDNFVGMKEECNLPDMTQKYNDKFKDKILIIGGAGGMNSYLKAFNWGQPAYLVGIGSFLPKIEIEFFNHLKEGATDKAQDIVLNYEKPFFTEAVKLGWHLALKEALCQHGLMHSYERAPLNQLDSDSKNIIKRILAENNYVSSN